VARPPTFRHLDMTGVEAEGEAGPAVHTHRPIGGSPGW
jgi:hypothetical protein